MKVTSSDPTFGTQAGGTTGVIGGTEGAAAVATHTGDTDDAHDASSISIANGALGVSQWPMLALSSGAPVAGPYFGGATNVQDALEYLAAAIAALSGGSTSTPRHWPMLALSSGGVAGPPVTSWLSTTGGGKGAVKAHGSLGSTETIGLAEGNYHWGTLNANCTFTFTGATDLWECWLTLELIEDGTGGWTVTWPGSVAWLGGTTPTHTTTAGTTTIYVFFTRNGGSTWVGGQLGGGSAGSFATPAIVLGSAAAAGAATTVIRSDSTIAAFDATVPAPVAAANATGSVAFAARRDHTHAYDTTSPYREVVMVTSSIPPDPVLNSAGDDWVYGSPV